MTTRELINRVLRGLRQFGLILDSGTSSTTDDYLLMILQFVNEAKEEIEESGWSWQALRTTMTVTVVAGQIEYDLTIAGDADVDTNDRTRLLYENVTAQYKSEGFFDNTSSRPQVFDVTDAAEHRLREWTQEQIERMHFTDNNDQQTTLHAFSVYTDGDSLRMKLWPTPDSTRTMKVRIYNPQTELLSTDLTTTLFIPSRAVWTKALFKANQERGEELGRDGSSSHIAALDAHGAAVAREQTPGDTTVGLDR